MHLETFETILKQIHAFYPIGSASKLYSHRPIEKLVKEKIDHLQGVKNSTLLTQWANYIKEIKPLYNFTVEDVNYLQFPSLLLKINEERVISEFVETKSFLLYLSMLAPYYTYCYTYQVKLNPNTTTKRSVELCHKKSQDFDKYEFLKLKIDYAPYNALTDEITKLKSLSYLNLAALNLTDLPDEFYKLQNIDTLILSMNYLIIQDKLEKLKELPRLNYLDILGNRIDTLAIEKWQNENSDLTIIYRFGSG